MIQEHSSKEPADNTGKYPCPCCGYIVFAEPPGSYDICPICYWEDDLSQLRFVRTGGANSVSLITGQQNYLRFGVCEERFRNIVRPPHANEVRDPEWHIIDPEQDDIEEPVSGLDYGSTYPEDGRALYYWWRKTH